MAKQTGPKFKIPMGAKVKDAVTGFVGVVTGAAAYITGCVQYLVTPSAVQKDGKYPDAHWFDEDRMVSMRGGVTIAVKPTGGPQPTPWRGDKYPPKR